MLSKELKSWIKENPNGVVFIVWPTASWKTQLSLDLINSGIDAEVISADSRQIYKYMDIWTDKVSKQIREKIPHHLIDIIEPDKPFTAWNWKKLALDKIEEIQSKNKVPFIVWWTWLYTDTLYKNYSLPEAEPDFEFRKKLYELENKNPWMLHKKLLEIDPKTASELNPNNLRYIIRALEIYEKTWRPKSEICYEQKVPFPIFMIIKRAEKEIANIKIDKRINEMFEQWLIEEVKKLFDMWYTQNHQWMQSIWYKEIIPYIKKQATKEEIIEKLQINTHRYAKRQRSFFRRYIYDMEENPKENVIYKFIK